jgi:KaiC/GvpD/RAD55 family RecA-like ATPase
MISERVPTGIGGLDQVIEGGIPRGSLVILGGSPGSGKTTFAAEFLCKGVDLGEAGIYVSFSENKAVFVHNVSRQLGRNCEDFISKAMLKFLDFATVREEGISAIFESILDEVAEAKAKRLVIDSYSAMSLSFKDKIDARIVTHTVLGKIVRNMGCTTLLISEVPADEEVGASFEEFVADGVIRLRTSELDRGLLRLLEIVKLRGTELLERKIVFTLKGGFKAFAPFKEVPVKSEEKFKPMPDLPGRFSTGSEDLDRLLDGGYPRGSMVLLEIDERVSTLQYHLILMPTALNFMANGRGHIAIPSSGLNYGVVKGSYLRAGFTEDDVRRLVRLVQNPESLSSDEPYVVKLEGKGAQEDYQLYLKGVNELINATGQPVLRTKGVNSEVAHYGKRAAVSIWNIEALRIRDEGSLGILILKPGYAVLSRILGAMVDVHLKLIREHGALLLRTVKPRATLHAVEMDATKGYVVSKLTPIV